MINIESAPGICVNLKYAPIKKQDTDQPLITIVIIKMIIFVAFFITNDVFSFAKIAIICAWYEFRTKKL